MTWELIPGLRPFRFGKSRDIGMTVYLLVAMLWFWLELPILVLAPMFFADPAGAIVGKWLSGLKDKGVINPVWWRGGGTTKTVGGSAAVLVITVVGARAVLNAWETGRFTLDCGWVSPSAVP